MTGVYLWCAVRATPDGNRGWGRVVRKLTDRQIAVLAAIERLGQPTLLELRHDLPALAPGDIARVLAALVIRGLVAEEGEPVHFTAVPRDSRTGSRDSVPAGD